MNDDAEELRRRLYRAGATDDDVRRYRDERAAAQAEPPTGPSSAPPRRGRRRAAAGRVHAAAAIAACCVAALLAVHLTRPAAPPRPSAAAGRTVAVDVGDGQLLELRPSTVTGPEPVAAAMGGFAIAGQRFRGSGDAVVPITGAVGASADGRAVVLLTASPGAARWRAIRLATRRDWTSYELLVGRGTATGRPAAFAFTGGPPARIVVEAAADTRWTLEVALAGEFARADP